MPFHSSASQRRPLLDILWEDAMMHGEDDDQQAADDRVAAPARAGQPPRHHPEDLAEEVEAILRRDRKEVPGRARARDSRPDLDQDRDRARAQTARARYDEQDRPSGRDDSHQPDLDRRYERIAERTMTEPLGYRTAAEAGFGPTSLSDMQKFAAAVSLLGDMAKRIFEDAEPRQASPQREPMHEAPPRRDFDPRDRRDPYAEDRYRRTAARDGYDNRLDRLSQRLDQLAGLMAEHVGGLTHAIEDLHHEISMGSRSAQMAGWRQMGDQARDDFSRSVEELRHWRDRISGLTLDPDRSSR